MRPIPHCATCFDVGWVCDNHPSSPWSKTAPAGCECGAGMPCPVCNGSDPNLRRDYLPTLPSDFKVDVDKNGSRL
jgi:hypothetical protein